MGSLQILWIVATILAYIGGFLLDIPPDEITFTADERGLPLQEFNLKAAAGRNAGSQTGISNAKTVYFF